MHFFFPAEHLSTIAAGYIGSTPPTTPDTYASATLFTVSVSSLVKHSPSAANSNFSKHPFVRSAPPSYLSSAFCTHAGSGGPKAFSSAVWWHLSRDATYFETHVSFFEAHLLALIGHKH